MRVFNDVDRRKKVGRITLPENPGNLTPEALSSLQEKFTASLKDGYLPCPVAFKLARESGVPKLAVGEIADRLGVRITDCQMGFFKVEKTAQQAAASGEPEEEVIKRVEALREQGELTCAALFELARELSLPPLRVAEAANRCGLKINQCQLGCF